MSNQSVLVRMISNRAEKNFDLSIKDNLEAWFKHWIATAEEIKAEFLRDGLSNTADEVQKLITTYSEVLEREKPQSFAVKVLEGEAHIVNPSEPEPELKEPILDDDYPIYPGYYYVADGQVIQSDYDRMSARTFKARKGIKELRRCDALKRGLKLRF